MSATATAPPPKTHLGHPKFHRKPAGRIRSQNKSPVQVDRGLPLGQKTDFLKKINSVVYNAEPFGAYFWYLGSTGSLEYDALIGRGLSHPRDKGEAAQGPTHPVILKRDPGLVPGTGSALTAHP